MKRKNILAAGVVVVAVAAAGAVGWRQLARARGQVADMSYDVRVAAPAFTTRHPVLLVDRGHHEFHTDDGRYAPFAGLARNDGFVVEHSDGALSAERLRGKDVLVIANARGADEAGETAAFSDAECDTIVAWVQAGGALLLVTDHYPFGAAVRALAARFGVDMSGGMTFDEERGQPGDESTISYAPGAGLGAHPITDGIRLVRAFTGQSLSVPAGATALLQLSDRATDRRAEAKTTRDGSDVRTSVEFVDPKPAAGRAQAVALTAGKGRVVVTGEAAMLTAQLDVRGRAFGMNVPGVDNRAFALRLLGWLGGAL